MIDLDKLATPISDDLPAGPDLRDVPADQTFQLLNEERTEIPPEEDPGGSGRVPNWERVLALCEEALGTTTKDLEIAVWLAGALARVHGFEGLNSGLRLVTRLLDSFWDQIHPGYDPETGVVLPVRARPLSWLGSAAESLRAAASCTIVPQSGEERALCWEDYRNTDLMDEKRVLADQSQYEGLRALGFIDGQEWNVRIGAVPAAELRKTLEAVIGCQAALEELRALADKQFGSDEAPNFVGLGELLLDLREHLEGRIPDEEQTAPDEEGLDSETAAAPAEASGPVASREEALRRLSQVAEYFRRTEPHSPISYLVERAIRWGHMPLMEVLQEFIEDPSSLARIQHNLGIQAGGSTES